MTTRFIDAFKTLGFRVETTPGTPLAIGDVDTFIRWYNIKCSPELEEYKRQIANGDWSNVESIMGKRKVTLTASVDLDPGVGVADPPKWMEVLRVCGFKRNDFTTTGTNFKDNPQYGNVTGTFWYQELQEGLAPSAVGIQISGAMGKAKFVSDDVGKPVRLDLEIMGVLNSIEDIPNANILDPVTSDFDAALPEAQLQVVFTLGIYEIQPSKWEIDTQAQIELETLLSAESGYKMAHMVAMNPVLKTDPYLSLHSEESWKALWFGNSTQILAIEIGNSLQILAPAVQLIKLHNHEERGRMVTNPLEMIFIKDPTDGAKGYGLKVLHGSEF